jgi:hypothetical protein
MRTARSITSGENFGDFLMVAPFSIEGASSKDGAVQKRYGGYAAGLATGGLGFMQVLWDPNRQALHDKAAHTAVIDLRAPPRLPQLEAPAADP